jgi:putative transposase
MVWFAFCHLFSCLLDLFTVRRLTDAQKDIQILLLRQQVRVLQRKARQPKRFSRLEKILLAVLVAKLKRTTSDFRAQVQPILIFSPDTVLRWHRELVRRKWTFRRKAAAGRPKINPEVESLVLQLARENAGWGYDRIEGELVKLGYPIDRSSIRNLLKRHRLPPAHRRQPKSTWRTFLRHYQHQMLACDFFTIETLRLKRSMCSSSSNWARAEFTSRAVPSIPPPTGSRSKRVNCVGHLKIRHRLFATYSMIGTQSSLRHLIASLLRKTSK